MLSCWDIEASGISDIFRIPKFAYYFYQSQKSPYVDEFSQPMIYIASHWNEKSSLQIKVYSNCEEVGLYLNENLIQYQKAIPNELSGHLKFPPFEFTIPAFSSGALKAVGFIDGKQVAEHSVSTSANPKSIHLEIDESGKPVKLGENDLVFVYAKILDEQGHVAERATNEINFSIKGTSKAYIVGPQKVTAEAGIATILLKTNYSEEAIEIEASSPMLSSQKIAILSTSHKK